LRTRRAFRSSEIVPAHRLAAKVFVAGVAITAVIAEHRPGSKPHRRSDAHYRRRPISSHKNAVRRIVAVYPNISGSRADRAYHRHVCGSTDLDSKPDVRSGQQPTRQKHHRCDCLFHFLTLLTPLLNASPLPERKYLKLMAFTHVYTIYWWFCAARLVAFGQVA